MIDHVGGMALAFTAAAAKKAGRDAGWNSRAHEQSRNAGQARCQLVRSPVAR